MDITIRKAGDVNVLDFDGNLDTNSSPAAESEVNRLLDEGCRQILFNFSDFRSRLVRKYHWSKQLTIKINGAVKCFTAKDADNGERYSPKANQPLSNLRDTELFGHLFF